MADCPGQAGNFLSPLEIRLECSKCISNARLDFLQRLYDRRPIFERYAASDINLHLHGRLSGYGMGCLTFEAQAARDVLFDLRMDGNVRKSLMRNDVPVFVRVGDITQPRRPLTSRVRLQSLDRCDMVGIDALEPALLEPSSEAIFVVFKRKLRSSLLAAGIELGEFKDEVFESGSEVLTCFPDQDSKSHIVEGLGWEGDLDNVIGGIRIELDTDRVRLFFEHGVSPRFEISKVFACPRYSFETWIERMKVIRTHAILAA